MDVLKIFRIGSLLFAILQLGLVITDLVSRLGIDRALLFLSNSFSLELIVLSLINGFIVFTSESLVRNGNRKTAILSSLAALFAFLIISHGLLIAMVLYSTKNMLNLMMFTLFTWIGWEIIRAISNGLKYRSSRI